jgi:hypothetical protein
MKKRNKYFEREKKYKKLHRDLRENWESQRSLGYLELDPPVHWGYTSRYVLRNDIANRSDAWIFWNILEMSKNIHWKHNYIKHPPKDRKSFQLPFIREINKSTYDSLKPQVKKWFTESSKKCYFRGIYYYCTVPNFYFNIKVEKFYVDRVKIKDFVLLQEESEIFKQLNYFEYEYGLGFSRKAPTSYRRYYNTKFRRVSKIITKLNFEMYDEDNWIEYPLSGRHTAEYNYW